MGQHRVSTFINVSAIWLLFLVFTLLHLFANYRAVLTVSMETFNQNRLHILVNEYLRSGTVLSPRMANLREPVITSESFITDQTLWQAFLGSTS